VYLLDSDELLLESIRSQIKERELPLGVVQRLFGGKKDEEKEEMCALCLGILETSEIFSSASKVADSIDNSGYEWYMDHISLNIGLPPYVVARTFTFWQWYHSSTPSETLPGGNFDFFPSVKSIAREIMRSTGIRACEKVLEMGQGAQTQNDDDSSIAKFSQLHIQVSFAFDGNEAMSQKFQNDITVVTRRVENGVEDNTDAADQEQPSAKRQRLGFKSKRKMASSSIDLQRSIDAFLKTCRRKNTVFSAQSQLMRTHYSLTPAWKPSACLTVQISRPPIFLHGHYLKFLRGLPQSPWFISGQRVGKSSVQELLCDSISESYGCETYKFHSSGREDIDVRMLGAGRPYAIELCSPKKCPVRMEPKIPGLERASNENTSDVESKLLYWNRNGDKETLEVDTEQKKKTYCCVCYTSQPITPVLLRQKLDSKTDMQILQNTPLRVLHRRTVMERPKIIHEMKTKWLNQRSFMLTLVTSSGTYVKEFVHGDLGRTNPSVGQLLGCESDILQLDVLHVDVGGGKKSGD
jgi:tRNA U54 and U55 pseudouridine synthase Pus10